jgi:hypothetical protein
MILLKSNQLNKFVVTLTQNTTVCDPEYLFQFVHIFSKQEVRMILSDVSPHPTRYNEFMFVEGQGVGQIPFPYEGQYNYYVYAQTAGSGNLNPLLATELVEQGIAVFIVQSADTTNEYYVEFISDDEFDSNTIFAPDEINPPTPTATAGTTPTPTPSVTASNTPTVTPTQTNTPTGSGTPTPTPTNTSTPTQTQTPTNTNTPSQTATSTPTQTPTNTTTQTSTPTQTPSQTNTQTPTVTRTPTQTPSNTPNALCNLFVTITGATDPIYNGTYFYDSISYINSSNVIVAGADPSGASAILYKQSGNNLYLGRNYVSAFSQVWANLSGVTTTLVQPTSITDGVYVYPQSGPGNASYYLTYPPVCTLTPTPTSTQTPTPSQTQTQTPTNTSSPTQTPTVTQTPTNTASQTATPTQTPTPSITASPSQTPTNTMTPTNTSSPTQTPTNTSTPTQTTTQTPTPSQTPPASGTTEANTYLRAVVDAGGTGVTSTVSAATVTLFTSLVSNGLYNKITAFYPMLGGNSEGCKFNAKNPIDTNAAYRLTFNGGWTYNVSGMTSNGTNAYADTYLAPSALTIDNQHISIYLTNNSAPASSGRIYMGASNGSKYTLVGQTGTPNWFFGINSDGATYSPINTQGMIVVSSTGGTNTDQLYRNGSILYNINTGTKSTVGFSHFIGAFNNSGTAQQFYSNQYRFATIGSGLTAAEVSTLSTIINTFQTSIGRNVY